MYTNSLFDELKHSNGLGYTNFINNINCVNCVNSLNIGNNVNNVNTPSMYPNYIDFPIMHRKIPIKIILNDDEEVASVEHNSETTVENSIYHFPKRIN